MDPLLLRVFMNQVAFECDCFEHGAAGINEALKAKNTRLIFIHLQNMLVSAANLQKVL
jgi:hypothetical protein